MIKVKNLKKVYSDSISVNIDDISLSSNKIYGLLGPNGAGKTTTIRMLIGLLKPTCGQIFIDDKDIQGNPDVKRMIGYIPDNPNLYEDLTGMEFIRFIADLYSCDKTKLEEEIDYYINLFEIKESCNSLISSYSKGMKQKISIISTLIHKPQILILDEPFTGLDPITIKVLKNVLEEFSKEKNNIVILSTHDLDVADNICTDIIIMNHGKIILNKNLDVENRKSIEEIFFKIVK